MSPLDYFEWVRLLEREEFPGLFHEEGFVRPGLQGERRGQYLLFAPSHYFSPKKYPGAGMDCRLLTEEIVGELRQGKSLLSVGCGEAYLEQLLVRRLGVPKEQVALADVDGKAIPFGFQRHVFDMHGAWPRVEPADFVIFPESLVLNYRFPEEAVFVGGSLRYVRREQALYELICRASACLKPNGQVRMTGECLFEDSKEAVKSRLAEEGLKMVYGGSFVKVERE